MLAHECKDSADVKQWLLEELEHTPITEPIQTTIQGDDHWMAMKGFRRAFHIHTVYHHTTTNKYGFHVEEYADFVDFPNFGLYDSYEALIDGVVSRYTTHWSLPVVKDPPRPESSM